MRGDGDRPAGGMPEGCSCSKQVAARASAQESCPGDSGHGARLTWLAWGVFGLARGWNRQTWPSVGDRTKHPAANSSTMKGAKALASETERRRDRTANGESRGYAGASCFDPQKSPGLLGVNETTAGAVELRQLISGSIFAPPSDVTDRSKAVANPGRTRAAAGGAAVPGRPPGVRNARVWEWRLSRSRREPGGFFRCKAVTGRSSFRRGNRNSARTTKGRTSNVCDSATNRERELPGLLANTGAWSLQTGLGGALCSGNGTANGVPVF